MASVVNQIVTMNRGDTARLPLFINIGSKTNPERYPFTEQDTVYVGVMEPNKPFEESLIKKEYKYADLNEDGDIVVTFESTDTEFLMPGTYYYEIKLKHDVQDGQEDDEPFIATIIQRHKFVIVE